MIYKIKNTEVIEASPFREDEILCKLKKIYLVPKSNGEVPRKVNDCNI